jgi:hypothetical protein
VEDDCWSVEALRDVNSLAAYLPLKDEFKEREKDGAVVLCESDKKDSS